MMRDTEYDTVLHTVVCRGVVPEYFMNMVLYDHSLDSILCLELHLTSIIATCNDNYNKLRVYMLHAPRKTTPLNPDCRLYTVCILLSFRRHAQPPPVQTHRDFKEAADWLSSTENN